jgi:murein DD-endopeptidase MepM/ murein hydrolase activator NlpD
VISREFRARTAVACRTADHRHILRLGALSFLALVIAALGVRQTWASAGVMAAARSVKEQAALSLPTMAAALAKAPPAEPKPLPGADVDGDGQSDFMNPTGHPERTHDAYGYGAYGASRDGGERMHEGVDYVSTPGQEVRAPMSGFVARLGYAYAGDSKLRTVEIVNPALNYVARVLFDEPGVEVGQAVHLGQPIGQAQTLQDKYPGGMTNHVHLQIAHQGRGWMDCSRLIPEMRG